jgi:hypothetical protein
MSSLGHRKYEEDENGDDTDANEIIGIKKKKTKVESDFSMCNLTSSIGKLVNMSTLVMEAQLRNLDKH